MGGHRVVIRRRCAWAAVAAGAVLVGSASVAATADRATGTGAAPGGAAAASVRASCPAARHLRADARVAVVDSGIAPASRAADRVVERRDPSGAGSGEPDGHGAAVASIVVRRAPAVQLVDVRVLDREGSASAATLAAGIDAALDADAAVVNLSMAVPVADPGVRAALDRAVAAGVVVVVAAGNEGRDLSASPAWRAMAGHPCVVVVGAVDADGRPLARSNRGDGVVDAWARGDEAALHGAVDVPGSPVGTSAAAARVSGDLLS